MPKSKLTLTADRELIKRAKTLASRNRTSVSAIFSRMIVALTNTGETRNLPGPLTRKATGLIHLSPSVRDEKLLADALAEKYGLHK